MSDCVFCEILADRSPADVRWSTADSWAIVPLGPVTPGHLLVIPRVHVADAAERPYVTAAVMADAAEWASRQGRPFNLITSAGREATQSIFHLHVHYLPRSADDGLMVPWGTLHGENPQDRHLCRELSAIGRLWSEGPQGDPEARVGGAFADALDDLESRVRQRDD